jgi:hypothetical protein
MFEFKQQRKMKQTFYAQYSFSASLIVSDTITLKGFSCCVILLHKNHCTDFDKMLYTECTLPVS